MGWNNPPVPWKEFVARLGDRRLPAADGGDSPAWSHKRLPYQPPTLLKPRTDAPYAELHCHSNFSFLDGASHPEELAEEAARLGLEALALTDHDGLYGVVRFAEAAGELGLRTVFGAELSLELDRPQGGVADPSGCHLLVLARDPDGYARLSRALSLAHLRGQKGQPIADPDELAELAGGHWALLTGCRKGSVPQALVRHGIDAARGELDRLVAAFGREHVHVELWDHGDPHDGARNDALADLATDAGTGLVATNNVHYATPARHRLATALAAVRARRSLDELDGWLPAAATAHLRSGAEQAQRFARYPGVIERTTEIGLACAFDLKLVAPRLPDFDVPEGHTEASWLRHLVMRGARERYGPPGNERVPGAYDQLAHELQVITTLGFPGYFLIVWDIVEFCRRRNIYCQGRGSAANSAVCYALGITNADPVGLRLLFERFLSPARDGPPDIDLDIESGRREEAIQYVYDRYGRHNAAQVANVITYRPRSAVREAGKALGFSPGQVDAWSKQLDGWGPLAEAASAGPGGRPDHDIPQAVLDLAEQMQHLPRHLGIHSGGMVICDRPVIDVCPVEWATMADRSVLQWDKDDCAAVGLVKFDLLGLGMLEVLHRAVDLIRSTQGVEVDLANLDQEPAVYDMLCRADSVGVFQVESRAQMATLPRLKPRKFYDLVVEVALIRPGPIQGGSVHPYIRRHNGQETITYPHPLLKRPLEKTLGVPLFQEQLMEMAVEVAGFTPAEADELRQAMGAKRSHERMARLKDRLYAGMAARGISGEVADLVYDKLLAFANFGFPESHAVSFAYLVYASAWLKLHYPAAFLAALLNSQPMGFWAPQTLVADARRHGVVVRGPDVNASDADSTVEPDGAVRLGIREVRAIGDDLAERIVARRPYGSIEEVARGCGLGTAQAEALATAGAFASIEPDRRKALWIAGAVAGSRPTRRSGTRLRGGPEMDQLPGTITGTRAPDLPEMTLFDELGADLWATGVSPGSSPIELVRDRLDARGAIPAADLATVEPDSLVWVGGVVTHRQRPATASGITFLNLEDETGLVNVICSRGVWARYRRIARTSPALLIRGRLERAEGVINLVAQYLEPLPLRVPTTSRDFR